MLTLGLHGPLTVDAARKIALQHRAEINAGINPAAAKRKAGYTVADLCSQFIDQHASVAKKASSASMDKANIRNHVLPLLGSLSVEAVTSAEIEKFKLDVQRGRTAPVNASEIRKKQRGGATVAGGKGVANRCLALLSKMFNLAELWGHRTKGTNPVRGVAKFKENSKERFLTATELTRLWSVLDDRMKSQWTGLHYTEALFRLLILTGARLSEIQQLKWEYVDLRAARLQLPDSKTGSKTIHLPQAAVDELKSLQRVKGNPYVIVGRIEGRPLHNAQKPWQAIREAAGLQDVRIHDLRHTFASFAAGRGMSLQTVAKLLGHRSIATTQKYSHLGEDHMKLASDQLGRTIMDAARTPASPNAQSDEK